MNRVLVVEDERVIRSSLKRLLERHGHDVSEAETVRESLANFDLNAFDVVISDLRLPGAPGTDLIKATRAPVLIMTSYSSIRSAIDAIRKGAADYITKPFDHQELVDLVAKVVRDRPRRESQARQEPDSGNGAAAATAPLAGMLGSCPQILALSRDVQKVARTDSTALIYGESGTGKELVARAIHDLSARRKSPIIPVSCAAIPANLIEAELFGHGKDAFPGANTDRAGLVDEAHGGTLFLDEIGELPLDAQARLLQVLQENEIRPVGSVPSRKVDVRLVAATHQDLRARVAEGAFREDLFYRINVMTLTVPPLRERGDDILCLAKWLLESTCDRLQIPRLQFSSAALDAMVRYPWPGNVREMANAIERAAVLADGKEIHVNLLALDLDNTATRNGAASPPPATDGAANPAQATNGAANPAPGTNGTASPAANGDAGDLSLEDYFRRFVIDHEEIMNETQLAKALGISRKSLWERRQRLGIPRKRKDA